MIQQGTAVALGYFDGVHLGHRAVVGGAVELAQALSLIPCAFTFTTDTSRPAAKQGSGALMTCRQREDALLALGLQRVFCPDFSGFCRMDGETFVRELLVNRCGARAVCYGEDFRFGKGAGWNAAALEQLCAQYGVRAMRVTPVLDSGMPVSSTRIRAMLAQGDMAGASRLLGRPYGVDFPVVRGNGIGHTLKTPTINQPFPNGFALPRFGVYASFAQVDGVWYPAVSNIGVKPTVTDENAPAAETYLFGMSGNLYGLRVPVRFVKFLREEMRFPTLEALKGAIEQDCAAAKEFCASHPV